ncbi:MAG: aminopeptidase P family protein [Clostridia bacterium]|nr:aminopeptidase P family protein [Clostridia bacterium]
MNHLEAFINAMDADAALIHRPENLRWLAGYTGEGCLFITRSVHAVLTDFRYYEQVRRQSPSWELVEISGERNYPARIAELAKAHGARRVRIETDYLTYDAFVKLTAALKNVEPVPMDGVPEKLREIKDEAELASIRRAAAIASDAFMNILPRIHAGMTEKQVQRVLEFEMLELGSEGVAFDTIAAAGLNGALPHATPSDHVIRQGELLTLDFGATVDGYRSDMTRTVGFGKIDGELRQVYETVRMAQQLGLDALAVGKTCGDVDRVAREYIDARYPGTFGHSLGHGVGLFIHEQPRLASGSTAVLRCGHVVTVEPGIYIPGLGGCRIEDTVIMTAQGVINTVSAPKQLIEL